MTPALFAARRLISAVRRLPFAILFLVACGRSDRITPAPSGSNANGPDAILVRMPRAGGVARAYRWDHDSVVWTSQVRSPALDHVLAFDDEQGSLAFVDARGVPGRVDLRAGSIAAAAPAPLGGLTSADGWSIFGVLSNGDVSRLTPSGTWTFSPTVAPRALLPLADGSLVLMRDESGRTILQRLHPPEARITDTGSVPQARLVLRTELGDRIYFSGDSGLVGVRVRDLSRTKTVRLPAPVIDVVATPSGDRLFIALRGRRYLTVVDRFAETIERTIDLPGEASALRMDLDGQYVLARAAGGDSVRIVSVGTLRAIGSVRSAWRADLPLVGPDGGLATIVDGDVAVVDAQTRREWVRFARGEADAWSLIRWNGVRPRAAWLDEPVRFTRDSDATGTGDSSGAALGLATAAASGAYAPSAQQAATRAPATSSAPRPEPPAPAPGRKAEFTLSFAALLSEERARILAQSIRVDGKPVRVTPGLRDGERVYRIVFGPFDSREEAERAGKRTGLPFWVFEGAP